MIKEILNGKESRSVVVNGINKVCDTVKVTLGASGKNVLIKHSYISTQGHGLQHFPTICTKDGVTVVRFLTLSDSKENVGADLVKEAAEKTMTMAGDGTTTTCVLMQAIVNKGIKLVDKGANQQELKRTIDKTVDYVVSELKKMAVPLGDDNDKIRHIATVSANNDEVIGGLIADAFKKIGKNGDIDIEESKGIDTGIKVTDGFKINSGWVSEYLVNNKTKKECELIDPYILLYDKKISQMAQIENILVALQGSNKSLLIICDDMDGEALAAVVANTIRGTIKVCVIKSPDFGDNKREAMEDIAVVVGGNYLNDQKGSGLNEATLQTLGKAKKIIVSKDSTLIISGASNKKQMSSLLTALDNDIKNADGEKEKEKIGRRISKLTGSVAILYVGASTDVEMREKKDRCDDAVRATKSAISEGYVPGAATAFLRIKTLEGAHESVIFDSIKEPLIQICKNAGKDGVKIVKKVIEADGNFGYNVKTDKMEDLVLSGIIDPVKVLRCSLQNAASAASAILTSESLIVDCF